MTRVNEMGSLSPPVLWRGLSAAYTTDERQQMSSLPVKEQFSLHLLKSVFEGAILEGGAGWAGLRASLGTGEMVPVDVSERQATAGCDQPPPIYIDAEDIVFGEEVKPKRKKPVYALVWTWRKHKLVKTKALGTRKMRAWKKWQERNGWKVTNHETGYFASRAGELQSMSLHSYDASTKERIS